MIEAFHDEDARVRLVRLSRNFGHQAALNAGLDHARGDAVIMMDADLQDPPELLTTFIERWREGAEVVYGVREHRQGSVPKRIAYRIFYRLYRAARRHRRPSRRRRLLPARPGGRRRHPGPARAAAVPPGSAQLGRLRSGRRWPSTAPIASPASRSTS